MSTEIKKEIQLEIAHVLFIDTVGYSKLAVNEQRALIERLNDIVRATDEFQAAETTGRLIKIPTGDGMALVFYHSPEAPVDCALEISRALKDHPELPLRMGVHSGPVSGVIDLNGKANVAGAGINMAERVMDCGDAGHILVSKRVAQDLEHYPHWRPHLHDLGETEVKHGIRLSIVNLYTEELGNAAMPEKVKATRVTSAARERAVRRRKVLVVAALLVAAGATGFVMLRHKRPLPTAGSAIPEKSIAVLPFENLSRDPDNAYFADGIQDEILTRLSKIADLKVISRTSTEHYKSAPENLSDIGQQLRVAHIVEGSVQKSGDAVRVNVQLIKAANDSHLWAETFDRKLTDIFSVESEVSNSIADQLQAKLTGQEARVVAAKPTDNDGAYDAYLRGLAYTNKPAVMATDARKYLKEAVALDPNFALAWALLSYVDSNGYRTLTLPATEATREEARQAAERALTLRPNLGEGLFAKGYYHYSCLKEYDVATSYFEQARRLLPNNSLVPQSLAFVCRRRGQWEQTEAYFNEAERLDPRNTLVLTQHGLTLSAVRRFPDAIRKIDEVLNITPESKASMREKADIAQAEGDLPRAAQLVAGQDVKSWGSNDIVTHTSQATFERHPAQIIPQLKQLLNEHGPDLDVEQARFWLGWAQEQSGDHAAAQQTWHEVVTKLEVSVKVEPDSTYLLDSLALTSACLGDKNAALSYARRAMELVPIEKDALSGPAELEFYARTAALTGETDQAITALQKLLSIPYEGGLTKAAPLTPAMLRLDPMFDSLRNDPRFQKLASTALQATGK